MKIIESSCSEYTVLYNDNSQGDKLVVSLVALLQGNIIEKWFHLTILNETNSMLRLLHTNIGVCLIHSMFETGRYILRIEILISIFHPSSLKRPRLHTPASCNLTLTPFPLHIVNVTLNVSSVLSTLSI